MTPRSIDDFYSDRDRHHRGADEPDWENDDLPDRSVDSWLDGAKSVGAGPGPAGGRSKVVRRDASKSADSSGVRKARGGQGKRSPAAPSVRRASQYAADQPYSTPPRQPEIASRRAEGQPTFLTRVRWLLFRRKKRTAGQATPPPVTQASGQREAWQTADLRRRAPGLRRAPCPSCGAPISEQGTCRCS